MRVEGATSQKFLVCTDQILETLQALQFPEVDVAWGLGIGG